MKMKSMIVLFAVTILFTSGCSFQNSIEELVTGKYMMQDAKAEDSAWVLLEDGNKFEYNRGGVTSYRPKGTYSVENNELILSVNDNEVYRFKIKGNSLIFESGEYAESLIEIGTAFELTKNK
jgi:outer membrane lipoprotein-sorting protein